LDTKLYGDNVLVTKYCRVTGVSPGLRQKCEKTARTKNRHYQITSCIQEEYESRTDDDFPPPDQWWFNIQLNVGKGSVKGKGTDLILLYK